MGETSSRGLRLALLAVALAVCALVIGGFAGFLLGRVTKTRYLPADYIEIYTVTEIHEVTQKRYTVTATMQPIECVMKIVTITAWIHCFPDTTYTVLGNQTVTETQTVVSTDRGKAVTITVNTSTLTDTSTTRIEPPEKGKLPIVRSSDKNYQGTEVVPAFFGIAGDSALDGKPMEWALSKRQEFIDIAVTKAESLDLDGENLRQILTKLLFRVDELNFTGKQAGLPFLISNTTAQLPCLILKARHNDVDAWIIALNWEYKSGISISHVAVVVFKYGTDEVLFAASCA